MVSLKTQIAGFSFDNCLMNAAGVACMTVEELEAVRQSSAGTFITCLPFKSLSRNGHFSYH